MPSSFTITAVTNSIQLRSDRSGQASFTVFNSSGRPVRGRVSIVAQQEGADDWYTLEGDIEQGFEIAGTLQYIVRIVVPPESPAGSYSFRLNMVGVENPDDDFTQGPIVTFQVPEPVKKEPFPWKIPAIIAAVVLIFVVVAAVLIFGGGGPVQVPVVAASNVSDASKVLTESGLVVSSETKEEFSGQIERGMVIATDPPSGDEVQSGSVVTLVVSGGPEPAASTPTVLPTATQTPLPTPNATATAAAQSAATSTIVAGTAIAIQAANATATAQAVTIQTAVAQGLAQAAEATAVAQMAATQIAAAQAAATAEAAATQTAVAEMNAAATAEAAATQTAVAQMNAAAATQTAVAQVTAIAQAVAATQTAVAAQASKAVEVSGSFQQSNSITYEGNSSYQMGTNFETMVISGTLPSNGEIVFYVRVPRWNASAKCGSSQDKTANVWGNLNGASVGSIVSNWQAAETAWKRIEVNGNQGDFRLTLQAGEGDGCGWPAGTDPYYVSAITVE